MDTHPNLAYNFEPSIADRLEQMEINDGSVFTIVPLVEGVSRQILQPVRSECPFKYPVFQRPYIQGVRRDEK
jgi:hypothetical protein